MDITGLALILAGAILILIFGLPPDVRERIVSYLALVLGRTLRKVDEGEIKKGKKYLMISRIGLISLIVGFLLLLLEEII